MLEDHCSVHLVEGKVSVFDDIRQLQHIASNLVYNQTHAPTTIWSPSMDTVQFKRVQVKIKSLVSGVQSMFDTLKEKMYDFSGGRPVKHTIPQDHVDDLSSTQRGKSWLQAAYTEPRDQALMREMVFQDRWTLSSVDDDGTLRWNMTACGDFMRKAADIVDLIITLVHVGSGPPLRGEEITRDQISNGIQLRTLYLTFGQMIAIRRHSKDTNSKGMDSFNVCYFPKCLTEAICYYLLVIRPLEKLVASRMYTNEVMVQQYDLFLYVKYGKRMTSTQFSTTLEKLTSKYIGVGLSLQPLRHILIAFQRAYVEELRVHGNNIGDLVSSHTSQTANAHYAIEHGQPEGYTATYLLDVQEWCDSYHDAIGLGDRTIPLVPLRFSRRRARRLDTVLSMADSGNPSTTVKALLPLIKELTTTAYKSAMEDLKPFLSGELQAGTAEALQYMVAAGSVLEPEQHRKSTFGAPRQPETRPTKKLPFRSTPQPSQPSSTTRSRQVKRMLSSGEQPRPKRHLSSIQTRTSIYPEEDLDIDPQVTSTLGPTVSAPELALEPTTQPSTPLTRTFALRASEAEVESTAIELSSMSLMGYQPYAQTNLWAGEVAGTRVNSQAEGHEIRQAEDHEVGQTEDHEVGQTEDHEVGQPEDHVSSRSEDWKSSLPNASHTKDPLVALRELRRDTCAEFKSQEQRDLIQSIIDGNHTIGILPTGGGKSMAYELPPLCKGQLTIAAFPFRVLTSQAAQSCQDRGISFEQWTVSHPRSMDGKRLVLMAVETLLSHQIVE
jgi:hypothetical protein